MRRTLALMSVSDSHCTHQIWGQLAVGIPIAIIKDTSLAVLIPQKLRMQTTVAAREQNRCTGDTL